MNWFLWDKGYYRDKCLPRTTVSKGIQRFSYLSLPFGKSYLSLPFGKSYIKYL